MRQAGAYSGILSAAKNGPPHSLPLARIKKIMKKSGEDVKMISGEAPIVFSKACELFIEELTHKSWKAALRGKRRTLCKEDVAEAVVATDVFDFLVTLVSRSDGRVDIGVEGHTSENFELDLCSECEHDLNNKCSSEHKFN